MEKKLQDKCLPGLSHQLRQPLCPPGLFSPQPGHTPWGSLKTGFSSGTLTSSSSISTWPSLRDPAQFGLRQAPLQQQAEGRGSISGAGAASGHTSILRATQCCCTDFSPGKDWALPSPLRVSISCFHFQWLGILGVDKGGLKRVSGVIYSSVFGPLCLFCCSFEIKEYSSKREEKKEVIKESY